MYKEQPSIRYKTAGKEEDWTDYRMKLRVKKSDKESKA